MTDVRRVRREPPPFRRLTVRSTAMISTRMMRIVLGGDELAGFAIEAPASSVRLLLPPPGERELVMPTWTGNQFELPSGARAPIRTFTPRYFDADRLELTIDAVIHDGGAATDWARAAEVGDPSAISGPGRSERPDAEATSHLLVGDETALPAIGQLLEALPRDQPVEVHAEIAEPGAELDLPPHPRATVTWHVLGVNDPPGAAMEAAIRAVAPLPEAVWVAGEAAAVQRIRTHLFDERGRSRSDVTARGYWKLGRSAT